MKSCLLSELLLVSFEKTVAFSQIHIFEMVAEGSCARDAQGQADSTLFCSSV